MKISPISKSAFHAAHDVIEKRKSLGDVTVRIVQQVVEVGPRNFKGAPHRDAVGRTLRETRVTRAEARGFPVVVVTGGCQGSLGEHPVDVGQGLVARELLVVVVADAVQAGPLSSEHRVVR